MRWQAPELLSPDTEENGGYQHGSRASDVYALACTCYEVRFPTILMNHEKPTASQMFSGQVPFYEDPSNIRVVLGVMQGRRPTRPLNDLSRTRGLNDEVWHLIMTCWIQDPIQRPSAKQVVEQLRSLPNQPVDQRPLDNINVNFPSQTLYRHTEHPFSVLATIN
jgi:serine/threonine protein kinase